MHHSFFPCVEHKLDKSWPNHDIAYAKLEANHRGGAARVLGMGGIRKHVKPHMVILSSKQTKIGSVYPGHRASVEHAGAK